MDASRQKTTFPHVSPPHVEISGGERTRQHSTGVGGRDLVLYADKKRHEIGPKIDKAQSHRLACWKESFSFSACCRTLFLVRRTLHEKLTRVTCKPVYMTTAVAAHAPRPTYVIKTLCGACRALSKIMTLKNWQTEGWLYPQSRSAYPGELQLNLV